MRTNTKFDTFLYEIRTQNVSPSFNNPRLKIGVSSLAASRSSIISPFCSSPATAPFKAQRHSQLALRFHQKDCSDVTAELQLLHTGASQTMVTTSTPHRVTPGSVQVISLLSAGRQYQLFSYLLRSSIISPFCSSPATAPFKAQRHSQLALRFHQKDCSNVTAELQLFHTGASQTMVTTATPHRVTTGSGSVRTECQGSVMMMMLEKSFVGKYFRINVIGD
ncbi:UNVERIFIED_CONTAM: hypothetical protein FKN15_031754 [Acipenser sinensis]